MDLDDLSFSVNLGPIRVDFESPTRRAGATAKPWITDDLSSGAADAVCIAVSRSNEALPALRVLVPPRESGSVWGARVAYCASTGLLFVGAGELVSAYTLLPPARLWVEAIEAGVHEIRIHDGIVVVSGELELAAWDAAGAKLWTRFVEPPWHYDVHDGAVELDIMGVMSTFPLRSGPT